MNGSRRLGKVAQILALAQASGREYRGGPLAGMPVAHGGRKRLWRARCGFNKP
ncbi:ATPase [Pseudomonas sp. St29]|nr:ATPase [Pseudomonas sp. St29]